MRSDSGEAIIDRALREHHGGLLEIVYRLVGTVSDAEDAVQEAYSRLARQRPDELADLPGSLIVVVSRVCLDQLGSARATREAYVGPWLP
jgi:RNA polymerase sigma-70 factor (ECF subfamily)